MNFLKTNSYQELVNLANDNVVVSTTYHGEINESNRDFSQLKNKIILYSQIGELLRDDQIENMLSRDYSNYYIFLLSHEISSVLKDKFKNSASFINLKYANSYYTHNMVYKNVNFDAIKNSNKFLHFLSLNNRATWFRQGLFYFFENFNLRNKAYFSYIGDYERTPYQSLDEIDQDFSAGEYGNVWYADKIDFKESKKLLPLTTGLVDNFDYNDWGIGNSKYYEDCFCSIVTETHSLDKFPFFTEKTFKPILFYQPFLLHSNPYSFDALRDMGFQTFEQWIDQSYDKLVGRQRFEAMLRVILDMSTWSPEKINSVYQEMLPVLEHNHNHFTKSLPLLYNKEIAQVKIQIEEIIANR